MSILKKLIKSALVFLFVAINISGVFLFPLPLARADEEEEGIIVKYKPGVDKEKKKSESRQREQKPDTEIKGIDALIIKVKRGLKQKALDDLMKDADIEYAEPDHELKAFGITNDPSLSRTWGMFKIEAAKSDGTGAWDIASGNGINIAVLDTGIDEFHPDLTGKIVSRQNFSSSATVNDVAGHGSHVAGIIAANANNSQGAAGVAYSAGIMNVKVLDDNGSGATSRIANGIIWAVDNGAKVINLSLGGPNPSATLQNAIDYAWNRGVVVVAAAGNDGRTTANYPAYYSNVIAVAATDSDDKRSSWSTYGSWVDVAAPGDSIYSTYKNGGYASLSGTSMATPHVAGLAGLVWSRGECATNACVRSKIETTADKISGTGTSWSAGRINALKAVGGVTAPAPTPAPDPTPAPAPAPAPDPVSPTLITSQSMSYSYLYAGRYYVYLKISAKDQTGKPLSNATVSASVTTPMGGILSGNSRTASDGTVTFRLLTQTRGTYSGKITSASKNGYVWNKNGGNASITIP